MNSLFRVSERNHIGMILMSELARTYATEEYLSLQDIAKRMRLSLGYLEEIAYALKTANLVQGRKGPGGGYRLALAPNQITADQILTALEGPLMLVPCQDKNTGCPVETSCHSSSLWGRLQRDIVSALHQTTLADLH